MIITRYNIKLDGPTKLADALPAGWTTRPAEPEDATMIYEHFIGTQGDWKVFGEPFQASKTRYGGLGALKPELIEFFINKNKYWNNPEATAITGYDLTNNVYCAPLIYDDR